MINSILGDDPRASLPNYVYTEQTPANRNSRQGDENVSRNDHEHQMNASNKSLLDQSDIQLDNSSISTRNSTKKHKINTHQRTTITRKQAKDKDLINGHNEVSMRGNIQIV